MRVVKFLFVTVLMASVTAMSAPPDKYVAPVTSATMSYDNNTFIDANQILMFVTNHGCFGRDLDDIFNIDAPYNTHGTWWPYQGDTSLISHDVDSAVSKTPLFSAGLWMAGVDSVTNDTLAAVSEYVGEYVPGPMDGGTFMPDDPAFRVYKLYMDSLGANPNADYLNWPTDQGAPLDAFGNPEMLGRQMLWAVFNDADPSAHTTDAGSTAPMGIEVRQTVWAGDALGEDTIYYGTVFPTQRIVLSDYEIDVTAWAVEQGNLTGDDYRVTFDDTVLTATVEDPVDGTIVDTVAFFAWHLDNATDDVRLLEWQYPESTSVEVEGFKVRVNNVQNTFESFEVVANASGALDPALPGAYATAGFPTPGDADPGADQQVGSGMWAFHTADNGGTSGGGTRGDFSAFIDRVLRSGSSYEALGHYDYEMRFTGSYSNPGVGGSYAFEAYNDDNVFWVPFEIWQTGIGTPDDPSDDVRLVPWIIDDYGVYFTGNDAYGLESWGSIADGTCSGDCEHSTSDGDDDPFTDWVYWYEPIDMSPGEAGYLANEADMLAGTYDYSLVANEIMARTVLVSLDAGKEPPFGQDYPEEGTILRIRTAGPEAPPDTITFTADKPPYYIGSLDESSVYIRYKLYNRGDRVIKDMFTGFWSDPDLGYPSDNFGGCDTLDNIWFCYNADNDDAVYGVAPPAIGFKILYGPVVPSTGESAYFDGNIVADHKNLGLTAFWLWYNDTDAQDYDETYFAMNGITRVGQPYIYNDGFTIDTLMFMRSGDPVTGTGDLDIAPASRRMFAVSGPFDMHPGDSQYVLIKMAVGKGTDNLNSITELRAILNEPFDPLTDVPGGGIPGLPDRFAVRQNYPNPFNPSTVIEYTLPRRSAVTVDVYNILGQRVRRLVDEVKPAGEHSVVWDGTNGNGDAVSTGLYFYRVKAGDSVDSKKMLLLK